jgi:hypothetical protein
LVDEKQLADGMVVVLANEWVLELVAAVVEQQSTMDLCFD